MKNNDRVNINGSAKTRAEMDFIRCETVRIYKKTGSIKETAKRMGFSPYKTLKILVEADAYENDTSREIRVLLEQGYKCAEIAEILNLSFSTVCTYSAYRGSMYYLENKTLGAQYAKVCNDRKKVVENNNINNLRKKN